MPGPAYRLVFEINVIHEYFTEAAHCRFDFLPDAHTAQWLRRTRCILRPRANRLQVMAEIAGDAIARAGPVTLNFAVRAVDPGFGRYTAGVRSAATGDSSIVLMFDAAAAIAAAPGGGYSFDPAGMAAPAVITASSILGSGFVIAIPLLGGEPAGRVYRVDLASRAMPWTYVLNGDWSAENPVVIDPAAADPEGAFDPVANPSGDVGATFAFRSRLPLALAERPKRNFELWSRRSGQRDRLLVRKLPMPDAANLARSDPADKASLVCEIFVSR